MFPPLKPNKHRGKRNKAATIQIFVTGKRKIHFRLICIMSHPPQNGILSRTENETKKKSNKSQFSGAKRLVAAPLGCTQITDPNLHKFA